MILLVEPARTRAVPTGGYLYNSRVGEALERAGEGRRITVPQIDLVQVVAAAGPDDVVVVDALFGPVVTHALRETRAATRLLVHWLPHRTPDLDRKERQRRETALLRQVEAADSVISTSTTAREALDRSARVDVAVPGVDHDSAHTAHPPAHDAPRVVVCIGPLTSLKASAMIVRACAEAPEPRPRLILVGDAEADAAYTGTCGSIGGVDVHMTGAVAPSEALAHLVRADLYASASRLESYGMATAQALSVGLPVVVTRTGDVARGLDDDDRARVVPVDDQSALSAALHAALAEPLRPHRPRPMPDWDACVAAFRNACNGAGA